MASLDDIREALKILMSAGLRSTPERAVLSDLVETWARLLRDVPGEALRQAADDIVLTEEFWPTLKKFREAAHQVQTHNFQSVAINPWKNEISTLRTYPCCAQIARDGHYYILAIDALQPRKESFNFYPPEVWARLQAIEERTLGILSEKDCREIDQITAPYQEEIDAWV